MLVGYVFTFNLTLYPAYTKPLVLATSCLVLSGEILSVLSGRTSHLCSQMNGKLCFEVVLGENALITTVFLFQVGLYAMILHLFLVVYRIIDRQERWWILC